MSIKDITDYVRLTPGNTNPSVIGSMVQSEVNGTLKDSMAYTDEQIKLLGKSGAAGRTEIEVITHGGSGEIIDISGEGQFYHYISEDTLDLTTVKRVVFINKYGMERVVAPPTYTFTPMSEGGGQSLIVSAVGMEPIGLLLSLGENNVLGLAKGLYSYTDKEGYVSRIECETIHPIDPKFIPGAVLPVVHIPENTSELGSELSAESAIALASAISSSGFCLAVLPFGAIPNIVICQKFTEGDESGMIGFFYYKRDVDDKMLEAQIMLGFIDGIGTAFMNHI